MIEENKIEELCLKGESDTLDYKREQYEFCGGDNDKKSELLKDVLAFANAWREVSAYILVGVTEKEGKGEIEGIRPDDIIDDADIQQFINSKTNKKIPLSCFTVNCKKGIVQVIEIKDCISERPFYIIKDFGKIKKEVVKIRWSTSTDDASPDEIAKMVEAKIAEKQPALEAQISSAGSGKYSTSEIILHTFDSDFEKQQTTYKQNDPVMNIVNIHRNISIEKKQKWLKECFGICSINLKLKNISDVQAKDLRIETEIKHASVKIETLDYYPSKPSIMNVSFNLPVNDFVRRVLNIHSCDTYFGEKIIYLRPEKSGVSTLVITIYGENLSQPLVFNFKLNFFVEKREFPPECFKDEYWNYFEEDRILELQNGEYETS